MKSTVLKLDLTQAHVKGRPLGIHLAVASLRVLEGYREILGTIDRIGTVAAVAAAAPLEGAATAPASDPGATLAQIAVEGGLDKETLRRRVLRLVNDGVLERRDGRVRLQADFLSGVAFTSALQCHLTAVGKLANLLCNEGLLAAHEPGCAKFHTCRQGLDSNSAWPASRILLRSVNHSLRAYRRVTGSTDRVLVALAVIAITAQHLTRFELPAVLEDLRTPIPRERLATCNISSIAAAAGLPFETTRRKVHELIGTGSLMRTADGSVQFKPGILQHPKVYDLITRNTSGIVTVINALLHIGLLDYSRTDNRVQPMYG